MSDLTLATLVKHLAHMEDLNFTEELVDLWRAAATRSRAVVDGALAAGGMGSLGGYLP